MQTFLPSEDFLVSAAILDRQRLGKQRVETLQILKSLRGEGGLKGGWARHPASRMWEGHELALLSYQEATCFEWTIQRGYRDTCWMKSKALFTTEELDRFRADDYPLLTAVAKNPRTSRKALDRMTKHKSRQVAIAIASRYGLPVETAQLLISRNPNDATIKALVLNNLRNR